ncbi:hypothetical protein [Streptomyces huiliensis]|uniref:hypothetical protein n=1 Tax=Streptomyces huiliensis TaxID=2876027 RepID=UPI001CBAD5D3|nr:hypothetical protein [Streptomyces huiliensis]MBZ4324420.1 hypothetical protein [Streptomyces huiliensis]
MDTAADITTAREAAGEALRDYWDNAEFDTPDALEPDAAGIRERYAALLAAAPGGRTVDWARVPLPASVRAPLPAGAPVRFLGELYFHGHAER